MKLYFVFTLFLVLASAMLTSATRGCICTLEYAPVCGKNGKTYSNKCQASCAGVRVAYPGPCGGRV